MPTAKKLPSGSWRCRVVDHYEYDENGKKKAKTKSFTVSDPTYKGKRECERLAAEWSAKKEEEIHADITISEAIEAYISLKGKTLSPSTITAYKSYQRCSYDSIGRIPVSEITSTDIQRWINSLDNTPKTVRNKYALLTAAIGMFSDKTYRVSLPGKIKPKLYTPTDDELVRLIHYIKEKGDDDLLLAVYLSALCSLRRGEICALTVEDITGGYIHINKAVTITSDGNYTTKQPKTYSSYREIPCPDIIADMIKGRKGKLIQCRPSNIGERFRRAVKHCFGGEVYFRFHDLRSYYVTLASTIGVPEQVILKTGGWKTDHVMKEVYRRTQKDVERQEQMRISDHVTKKLLP